MLDSLDLKNEEYHEENSAWSYLLQSFPTTGESSEANPIPVRRVRSSTKTSSSIKKVFRGSDFVRHLIPDNIKEVEFIYKVNFDAGKGPTGIFPLSLVENFNNSIGINSLIHRIWSIGYRQDPKKLKYATI